MFARLTNFLSKNTREETQLLLPTKNTQKPRDAFDKVPNDVVMTIASFLSPKEMARFAQTNKRMQSLVEKTPTTFEVHQLVDGETQVSKNATYAQLRKAFSERLPIERQITKAQPGKLATSIRTHENCIVGTCTSTTMLVGSTALFSGVPLMSVSASLGICLYVGGAVSTLGVPICILLGHKKFERQQVRRDEQMSALQSELKTKPQVFAMRK